MNKIVSRNYEKMYKGGANIKIKFAEKELPSQSVFKYAVFKHNKKRVFQTRQQFFSWV